MTPTPRTGAVLFAHDLDRVAAFYAAVLGLVEAHRDTHHIRLESPGYELVVHATHTAPEDASTPPARRSSAAFKPVYFVPDIAPLRRIAPGLGGALEPATQEWSFHGVTVCDGVDPEGNVVQFRAPAA